MKRHLSLITALTVACIASACYPGPGPANPDTTTTGNCEYKDEKEPAPGQSPTPPAQPEPQPEEKPMEVEIKVSGVGNLGGLTTPACSLEGASGNFKGLMQGQGEVDENGTYYAGFLQSEGTFTTPSAACTIPDLSISSLTEVVIKARLSNTSQNCNTYCAAKARSKAEAACEGSSNEASCRSSQEASYEASCKTTCSGTTTRRITAETRLSLSALATLNAQGLGVNGLGDIEADFTFEKIEESTTGQTVEQ